MRRYNTRKGREVDWIRRALEISGATVLAAPDGKTAPYEFTIVTMSGETIELVCYAFYAKRFEQEDLDAEDSDDEPGEVDEDSPRAKLSRPLNEHRFQIKYGGDLSGYHEIFVDPSGRKTTLMFGVHLDLDLAIAVDPAMHNPTRFSVSVEFKLAELEEALRTGWHGWERERSDARRQKPKPQDDLRTEAVIAFRPENFLRYVLFERVAVGMDAGERLALSDRAEATSGAALDVLFSLPRAATTALVPQHPLELLTGLSSYEILDVINAHFRLLVALRGSVAEHHLGVLLRGVLGGAVTHLDKDGEADFAIAVGDRRIRLECKNVLARLAHGHPKVDFQKTRPSANDPCTRYYAPTDFEVLAACLHPVSSSWSYVFARTVDLAPHKKCCGRLSPHVEVDGSIWSPDIRVVLAAV